MARTTQDDIRRWLLEGQKDGATHVIVVCDTFDYEDYPVCVMPNQNVEERVKYYQSASMQRVMEVYNLSLDLESQLEERRAYHVEPWSAEFIAPSNKGSATEEDIQSNLRDLFNDEETVDS